MQSEVEELGDYEDLDIQDHVPLQWLPPFEGAGGSGVSAAAPVPSRAASLRSASSPTATAPGSEAGSGAGGGGSAPNSRGLRQVLPMPRAAGRCAHSCTRGGGGGGG